MTLIKRFINIIKATFGDRGYSPSKKLAHVSEKLRMDIVNAKRQAVESITREKVLVKELTRQKDAVKKWEVRAENAVKSEQDGLAKEALKEKASAMKRYGELHLQYGELSASNAILKQNLRQMELKEAELQDNINEMYTKLATTKARSEARKIKSDTSDMQRVLENIQDEIDVMAEYITVHEEIDQELDSTDNVLRQLDDERVEDELVRVKENISKTNGNNSEILRREENE